MLECVATVLCVLSMLKSTPSRLGRQTDPGGMIWKHCGWEAMIWALSSQCAISAAPDQSPTAPRHQPTNVGALSSATRQPVPQQRHLTRSTLLSSTKQKQPNITPRNVEGRVTSHAPEVKKTTVKYISPYVSYNWFMFAGPFQITYMYLGFSSPISAISSSVFPVIFQSSLPALLPWFLLTKYNDTDA
jgi:hypothetical protein